MGIYFGESQGFIFKQRTPSTTEEKDCQYCKGTGKKIIQNYTYTTKEYIGDDWVKQLDAYINSDHFNKDVESFGIRAEMFTTYGPGSSLGTCPQYDSCGYKTKPFLEWWNENKAIFKID